MSPLTTPCLIFGRGFMIVYNAKELCDLLTHLNISGDTKLESMRQALESSMYGLDVKDVRNSDYQRTILKSAVDDILSKF
jgi:hypothetical protein